MFCVCSFPELPAFKRELEDLEVYVTRSFTLTAETRRFDMHVEWYLDEMPISERWKYKMFSDGYVQQLTVYEAVLDDEGEYACLTKDGKSMCYVTVNGRWAS